MCHVLLLLPVLALPVFWIWPAEIALPVYGVAAAVPFGIYALVYWAWKVPLAHGPQMLIGATGHVVSVEGRRVTLRVRGELWLADARGELLKQGEEAEVTAIDGLRLTATRRDGASGRAS